MPSSRRDLRVVYAVEGITCVGTNLLLLGIYFYTQEKLGWGLMQNFLLAAAQGLVYVAGSLLAHPVTVWLGGRRNALVAIYGGMAALAGLAGAASSPWLITTLLLLYTLVTSLNWPMLESLVSSDVDAHELSRRVGVYNLVWSGTGALAIAANGALIAYAPLGVFLVPVVVHAASAAMMLLVREPDAGTAAGDAHGHLAAEPELLSVRRLALALSRVSLPATYVVIYSLMAMMPSLPVIRDLSPVGATVVSSTWMAVRWVTFLALGATSWWHTRPRLLLASAVAMVAAFLAIVLPGARLWLWHEASVGGALGWMLAGQALLGVCVGVIYSGSLYFGMVLSEGSTEHGGYHEALIGLGSGLGPAAGAVAAWLRPGDVQTGIFAVTLVITLSVAATLATAALADRRGPVPGS